MAGAVKRSSSRLLSISIVFAVIAALAAVLLVGPLLFGAFQSNSCSEEYIEQHPGFVCRDTGTNAP
ncbi:hypothetical protein SAMN05216554_3994 [Herbiconiux ginsengi]|uniref:Uncharacterized protein n=1 Tax=Herbiconiux ginsengi TaxID=381665 RepID=A0A1H3T5X8_9MICO|nr:hypothetical protein SAMN05216554_3994 [Herbiconiux ginsengi]